jgi:iron complex transport system permease protein
VSSVESLRSGASSGAASTAAPNVASNVASNVAPTASRRDTRPGVRWRQQRHRPGARTAVATAGLSVLVLGLLLVNVLLGAYQVTIPDLRRILSGEVIPGASFVVLEDKLPRAVLGLLVGASLGTAGALFQTVLRNPLASPDVIGVSAGASAGSLVAVVAFGVSGLGVPVAALTGATAVALAVHQLAGEGAGCAQRLVLLGVGAAAVLQSGISYLLTRADLTTAAEAFVWLTGSLSSATWQRIGYMLVTLLLLAPAAAACGRHLRALELGPDVARGLGVPAAAAPLALLVGVGRAAVGTAAAGPVAFVAFLAGPTSRRLIRGRTSLLCAGLVGAALVLGAEYVARNVIPGTSLPVGVVTGALGAPFLIWSLTAAGRTVRGA